MDICIPEGISIISISGLKDERLTWSVRCPGDGHEELSLGRIADKAVVLSD
jgi:hypothetical protein